MNRFLRTAPTRKLLIALAAAIAVVAGGTAIAIAAQGSGPVPRSEPLATAIHQALSAGKVTALSARVSFTNNLIDAAEIQGSDPLLSGGSGRMWLSAQGLRVELQGDNGDTNLVVRDGSFWAYDPASNTVYEGTLPAHAKATGAKAPDRAKADAIPSIAQIQRALTHAMAHLAISRAKPGDLAGRPTYTVRVSPRQSGGLLGGAELAWDALRGVPLRFAIYARGDGTPVLALQATGVSYGAVNRSVFTISPPAGAKVVQISLPKPAGGARAGAGRRVHTARAKSAERTAQALAKLPFTLVDPAVLAGMQRASVSPLGRRGALALYGRYLGGIAVIEEPAPAHPVTISAPAGGDQPGFSLPSLSINGSTGQELDTALGTVIRFSQAGVEYTVIGSVTPSVARAAARAL